MVNALKIMLLNDCCLSLFFVKKNLVIVYAVGTVGKHLRLAACPNPVIVYVVGLYARTIESPKYIFFRFILFVYLLTVVFLIRLVDM